MDKTRIAIVGAGPAGLMLGNLLKKANVDFEIYEGEANANFRTQGGSLDLHPGEASGLAAIEMAGLNDAFNKYARPEGDEKRCLDKDGFVYFKLLGQTDRPEIDRLQLRQILLEPLANEIKWGKKLQEVEPASNDSHILRFQDGTTAQADLIVGCDGAWSKVRKLLTDQMPSYSGVTMVETEVDDVDTKYPSIVAYVGQGMSWIVGDDMCIIPQRNSGGKIRTYLNFNVDESWLEKTVRLSKPEEAKEDLLKLFPGWRPDLLDTIRYARDDSIVGRKLYSFPIGFTWPHRNGVTVIGDAAHVMTPFAGIGVNLAFGDAIQLAKAIIESKGQSNHVLNTKLADFEKAMWKRVKPAAQQTETNLEANFHRSPRVLLTRFASYVLPAPFSWWAGNTFYSVMRVKKTLQGL